MASDRARTLRDAVVVLLCFAAAAVGCAFLWHWWWAPAPVGFVVQGEPFFLPDEEFRSTATYVSVAAPAGVLLGAVLTWWLRRDPLVVVLAVLAGSVLAAGVMAALGTVLGPDSADTAARSLKDFAPVRAGLRAEPGAAWLAFPVGAVTAGFFVLLGGSPDRNRG